MYQNIPEELRKLRQWIVWRYDDVGAAKPTKIPYDARTGKYAATDNPDTWNDFNTCVAAVSSKGYSGIGFIFTANDDYSFIDLDDTKGDKVSLDRQIKISKEFDSYSEISPSGNGLHIIVKGSVPAGRKRNFIEIYSSGRYATFTGNVHNNKPIVEYQQKLMSLWESMGAGPATYIYNGDSEEKYSDEQIIKQASDATNGDKFQRLYAGDWQNEYQSQSEADFAIIDIVAFYTQNRYQITRIFQASRLGNRDKAKRKDYIERMILRSFDRMLPPLDFDGFKNALELKLEQAKQIELPLAPVAQRLELSAHNGSVESSNLSGRTIKPTISLPPGLLGEIAQFIYAAAPRPVTEIALAGAIGLMAGIAGRAYNISGTGLNQYVLLLAKTGSGKESIASGIDKLMNNIRFQVPTSNGNVGPSEIASGQALVKHLSKVSQCFVSILGEFGLRLQQMSNVHASSADRTLKRTLLDLYNKSGFGQTVRPSIYADSEKNTLTFEAPAFSILAESTPDTFYGCLNEEMIAEGLLPRFFIIEYDGPRPPLNTNHVDFNPPNWLVDKMATFAGQCEIITHHKRVINVVSDPQADQMLTDFNNYCDKKINSTTSEVTLQLWNRAHIKALKLSALIAVGVNMFDPIITASFVTWSIDMVQHDIMALTTKFEAGEIGTNSIETKQQMDMVKVVRNYLTSDYGAVSKYMQSPKAEAMHKERVIPYVYLNRRLMAQAAFRNDRTGATNALKRTIQTFIESDKMREVGKQELSVKFGTSQRAFVISNPEVFLD